MTRKGKVYFQRAQKPSPFLERKSKLNTMSRIFRTLNSTIILHKSKGRSLTLALTASLKLNPKGKSNRKLRRHTKMMAMRMTNSKMKITTITRKFSLKIETTLLHQICPKYKSLKTLTKSTRIRSNFRKNKHRKFQHSKQIFSKTKFTRATSKMLRMAALYREK